MFGFTQKSLVWIFLTLLCLTCQAQVGIRAGFVQLEAPGFELAQRGQTFLSPPGNGPAFSMDYRLKIRNLRLEFRPEVQWVIPRSGESAGWRTSGNYMGIWGNVTLFPFDLKGDCDCPTFGRQGRPIHKSLFLEAAPGLHYLYNEVSVTIPGSNDMVFKDSFVAPGGAIGIGAELKLQRNLSVSPFARMIVLPNLSWPGLLEAAEAESLDPLEAQAFLSGLNVGLRIGFR
jgi:hypothetical protein